MKAHSSPSAAFASCGSLAFLGPVLFGTKRHALIPQTPPLQRIGAPRFGPPSRGNVRCRLRYRAASAQLDPPNSEVDWVFVDIATKNAPPSLTERLEDEVQDDAMSLVRTVLRDTSSELSLLLCCDEEIRKMNSKWRGMDNATDVLSFPQDDPDRVILGDVVISVETAERQAEERGLELRDELRILLLHGLLHLLGYDHEGAIEGDWLVV